MRYRTKPFFAADTKRLILTVLALITFVTQLPSFYGEDIVNARANYLTGSRTDFWGGVSSAVYGYLPNFGFRWQIWLAMFQIIITWAGMKNLFLTATIKNFRIFAYLGVSYLIFMFAAQMTRDGLMFSLLIFGLGVLKKALQTGKSSFSIVFSVLLIVFGLSFRPWMSVAVIPIILIVLKNWNKKRTKLLSISLILCVVFLPAAVEMGTTKVLGLAKSYPEQQVMIMDAAASYCYSSNRLTGERAREILLLFTSSPNFSSFACQLFRTETWISLSNTTNASADGFSSSFSLIGHDEDLQYETLRNSWLELIISDPVTYLKNKSLFAQKIMIGSDSRSLQILSEPSVVGKTFALYKIPYEIAVATHLLSIFACLMIFALIPVFQIYRNRQSAVFVDKFTLSIFGSLLLWTVFSSIAYIGSNGRYTYTITLLVFALYLSRESLARGTNGDN